MYWLCLCFHALSFEICFPRDPGTPCAVTEKNLVVAVNRAAAGAGIHIGCSIESALVSVPMLQVRPRNPSREETWLHERARRALALTPMVSVSGESLLLEIGGSERLFGGRERLLARALAALVSGAACHYAGAPTALAALCLARGGVTGCAENDFRQRFGALPVTALPVSGMTLQKLQDLGLRKTGECLKLPREGLARRFPELPALFDRAFGRIADPMTPYEPPVRFENRMDLVSAAWTWDEMQPVMEDLFAGLERELRRHAASVDCLDLELRYRHADPTLITVRFAHPQVSAHRLLTLCRERIGIERLPEAVEAIRIRTAVFLPGHGTAGHLFPLDSGGQGVGGDLLDHLRMRLGTRVHGLAEVSEHRPERAFTDSMPGTEAGASITRAARPLWLLHAPRRLSLRHGQPCYHGRSLCLREGPERIESGWWDGNDISRDYFIAQDASGTKLWVFNDLRGRQWFLQGVFS
ncbi:MAG: Y-family DNA polymerase [Acidiferrobacteraceae bacterium]